MLKIIHCVKNFYFSLINEEARTIFDRYEERINIIKKGILSKDWTIKNIYEFDIKNA